MNRKSSCARILSMFGWVSMVTSEVVTHNWKTVLNYIQDPNVNTSSLADGINTQTLGTFYLNDKSQSEEALHFMRENAFKPVFSSLFNLLKKTI